MRTVTGWLGLPFTLSGMAATVALAFAQPPTSARPQDQGAGQVAIDSKLIPNAPAVSLCMIGSDYFRAWPPSLHPMRLYDLNAFTGAASAPRATTGPNVIGLAWGPDNRLYGVSSFDTPIGLPNAVYRIDPANGAATLIGPTGLSPLSEGGLATHPQTGEIYGLGSEWLFRLSGITAADANPTAQKVALVSYPGPGLGWNVNGLAFDSAGKLYALAQSPGITGPPAHLIRLDLNNIVNGVIAVDQDVTLSQRLHDIGGLEFIGGQMYHAGGNTLGPAQGSTFDNLYYLSRINPSTGAVTAIGKYNILGGFSSLVSCAPQKTYCTPPPPDLDAWYAMDGSGNDLVLGKNAAATGNVFTGGTWVGPYMYFNGGYMTVPDGPVLDQGLGDFSIDLWTVMLPGDEKGIRTLMDKRSSTGSQVRGWALFTYQGRLALQLGDGGYSNFFDNRVLPVGWRHVAVTVDRDNPQGILFYIDGVAGTPSNPTGRQLSLDNAAPTYFARHALNGTLTPTLRLDEIEFFDRVLTPPEIRRIFDARQAGKCKTGFQ